MQPVLRWEGIRSRYTGKERDSESGLDNFGARYDSSQYGRFMSADEPFAGWDQHEPQSFNLYSYVENNPLNHVDPDGHDVQICVQDSSDEKKQTCTTVSDQKYQQLYNAQNGQQGINLPGGNFPTGNITCGGQTCGTARYFEPGMEDQTANLIGLAEGARGVLGLARAAYESIAGLFAKGAAEEGGVVIGKQTLLDTPGTLRPGERTLDLAEDMGSPKANWAQNSGKLREAMSEGQPIRDASAGGSNTGFLRAERNLLENHGWSLKGDYWYPPNR
jgi:RHS repeat-associated protein